MRYLFFLLGLVAPLSFAKAQHPLVLERLNAWNDAAPVPSMDVLEAEIRGKAATIYTAREACRTSAIMIDSIKPATADRHAFNGLVRGEMRNAWFVTARMSGCDDAPVRYMIMQDADNSLRAVRVNRGASHAWESLMGDTFPLVRLAAIAALHRQRIECSGEEATSLGVTRIASEEPNLGEETFGIRYSGRWAEVWPIEICNRIVEVSIRFTADGDGGAFTDISGEEIRILP